MRLRAPASTAWIRSRRKASSTAPKRIKSPRSRTFGSVAGRTSCCCGSTRGACARRSSTRKHRTDRERSHTSTASSTPMRLRASRSIENATAPSKDPHDRFLLPYVTYSSQNDTKKRPTKKAPHRGAFFSLCRKQHSEDRERVPLKER